MKEITLTITVDEANQILDALGTQPFKDVFQLIGKIQNQAAEQFNQSSTPPQQETPMQNNNPQP